MNILSVHCFLLLCLLVRPPPAKAIDWPMEKTDTETYAIMQQQVL